MRNKLVLPTALAVLMSGCASPLRDMMNNDFGSKDVEVAGDIAGTWTGSLGPFLATFEILPDGRGLYCYSGPGKDALMRLKYAAQRIEIQDGTHLRVLGVVEGVLELANPYGSFQYKLRRDADLAAAAPVCAEQLKAQREERLLIVKDRLQ